MRGLATNQEETQYKVTGRQKLGRLTERFRDFWKRYSRSRPAVAGLIVLIILGLVAVFADQVTLQNPYQLHPDQVLLPPTLQHIFGTDDLGRDVLGLVIFGSRVSLAVGLFSVLISASIGIAIGSLAGYYGGKIDDVLMRITDTLLVIPSFFLILIVIAFFGSSIWNIIMIIGLTSWPGTARLLRAQFLSLKNQEFVEAARAVGAGDWRIISAHIIPNGIYPVIVNASLQVAAAILLEAGLSFLGLGDPTQPSWGQMLTLAQLYLRKSWWMAIFPGFAICITVLSYNLVGDSLNDALNPRLKEG